MKRFFLIVPALFVWRGVSYGESNCKEPAGTYLNLLECAESRSPEVQTAQLELQKAKKQVQAAGHWKNPELSAETIQDKFGSGSQGETDISLGIPVELGGKISARVAVAQGSVLIAEAKLFEVRAKVRTQALLRMHRLRQALHEQDIVDEAINTFSKLVTQYSQRPSLSPEQQLSFSVFQLSRGEYDLKKVEIVDALLALDSYFKLTAGFGVDQIKNALPDSPKTWPALNLDKAKGLSPQQKLLQAEVETANAELALARSEAWPTLTVGPSFRVQTDAGQSNSLLGVNLSLPLPLFNANGGAKATAAAGVRSSEAKREMGTRQQELRREQLAKVYEQSIKVLGSSLSHKEIEKRHSDAEHLFAKGVVPSALVIEAHRASLELEKARHARELIAIESLLEIYAIDGVIVEPNL